jgi:sugar phosphate isomerase/epimerase
VTLAVSNIAWPAAADYEAENILRSSGIAGIEVAPTRLWPGWDGCSPEAGKSVAGQYAARGFSVPALQAILFGKAELNLFATQAERDKLLDHLRLCADLAVALGASSLVFGAPKNRRPNGLSQETAFGIAREVFVDIARYYELRGVYLCLEANPPQYGCEFITNSVDAGRLVRAVNSSGLRLHLDTACMYLAQEDPQEAVRSNFDVLHHFHVSEPFLGSFDRPVVNHRLVAQTLRELGYSRWVSLEMRETDTPIPDLRVAAEFLAQNYGGV